MVSNKVRDKFKNNVTTKHKALVFVLMRILAQKHPKNHPFLTLLFGHVALFPILSRLVKPNQGQPM